MIKALYLMKSSCRLKKLKLVNFSCLKTVNRTNNQIMEKI